MPLPTLSLAVLSLLASSVSLVPGAQAALPDIWNAPQNVHYSKDVSFRGLSDGRVSGYDVSGHAAALPGVHDFLRLVPAMPLAHGALFSTSTLPAKEWIVEVAFRVHGPQTSGLAESNEDGKLKTEKGEHGPVKGGRGLAFWVTKEGLPGPVTISSTSGKIGSPPALLPASSAADPSDPLVSLFGSRTSFDGLGIVFDSSPTSPLLRRSDPRNFADHHAAAQGVVGATGVVSGIMDDGMGKWLDKEGRITKGEEEAAYLERAVGECEAAFRNAQGLLWARIAHVNSTIRVDLDLSPHTTLSKAGRHYEHNCFTLEGIKLAPNMHLGLSALASGSTEPDAVDVYAMDVFEVLAPNEPSGPTDEPAEPNAGEEALEGTSDDEVPTLTHEIFLSQARMVEAIDALARKIESLTNTVSQLARNSGGAGAVPPQRPPPVVPAGGAASIPEQRLASLDAQLADLTAMVSAIRADEQSRVHEGESLTHLLQLQDRLMEEVKSVGRRVEGATGQHAASLSTLSSRSAEQLQLLKSTIDTQASGFFSSDLFGKLLWGAAGVAGGVILAAWKEKRRREGSDPWGPGGKKYF
ncbi:hypothetical protein JCM6882_003758 [Rhodosporidiobolus microsporus]